MPRKKSEEKSPVTSVSAVPASRTKTAKPRAARAHKTVAAATSSSESILNLSASVDGHVTAEQVAERAYFRWLERGCPMGSAEQDWIEAEQELGLHQPALW